MKLSKITLFLAVAAGLSLHEPAHACSSNGSGSGTSTTAPATKTPAKNIPNPEEGEPVIPFTGNEFKRVDDLQIWGSVGSIPMVWSRHSNSRATAGTSLFGVAHYWRHGFQWELASTSNDTTGRARVTLVYPDGAQFTFTEVSTGSWQATGTLSDQLLPTADGFVLLRQDATQYFFRKFPSGTTCYYLMDQIQDEAGNAYSLEYNKSHQVTKVTEPAGRFFQISYTVVTGNKLSPTTLATVSAAPAAGAWMELPVTNTTAVRYVRVLQADKSYGNIAEVEVYEAGTNAKLTGTAISSDSATAAQAAFDGDPTTGFVSSAQSGGYVGIDLGTKKKIGLVRVLSVAGQEALQKPASGLSALKIEGDNEAPISTTAISQVATNDGRTSIMSTRHSTILRFPTCSPR